VSPEGRERPIDPFYTLRFAMQYGLCGDEMFCYDVASTSVLCWGPREAWETLPKPSDDPRATHWDWQKDIKTFWQVQPLEELWAHVHTTIVGLAMARHPDIFREAKQERTRDTDVAIAETLHREHRVWLTWVTTTSPAIVPAPAPWRPMPAEKWAVEIQQAQAAGLLGEDEDDPVVT